MPLESLWETNVSLQSLVDDDKTSSRSKVFEDHDFCPEKLHRGVLDQSVRSTVLESMPPHPHHDIFFVRLLPRQIRCKFYSFLCLRCPIPECVEIPYGCTYILCSRTSKRSFMMMDAILDYIDNLSCPRV
jgi:hypothetical protein